MRTITEKEYDAIMLDIDKLMKKGEKNLSEMEFIELRELALLAQGYEKSVYSIPPPRTLEGMVELRMYEMKLKQKDLAKTLNISDAKLSLILAGKQKPDVPFIKAVYEHLKVPADFILQHI